MPFNENEIRQFVIVFQKIMMERGATPEDVRAIVAIARDNGKLGVHIYFPYSRYFPEECWWIARLARLRLEKEFPLRGRQGLDKKSWKDIVDEQIYNGSL